MPFGLARLFCILLGIRGAFRLLRVCGTTLGTLFRPAFFTRFAGGLTGISRGFLRAGLTPFLLLYIVLRSGGLGIAIFVARGLARLGSVGLLLFRVRRFFSRRFLASRVRIIARLFRTVPGLLGFITIAVALLLVPCRLICLIA